MQLKTYTDNYPVHQDFHQMPANALALQWICKSLSDILTQQLNTTVHQHNVIMSLGASGSVWELSDQNPRVVKSQRCLDQCSGLQVRMGACWSAGDNPGSADNRPGSTWECRQQAWAHLESQWSRLGKTFSLGMQLVHQEFIGTTSRSMILKPPAFSLYSPLHIDVSMNLYSHPSTYGMSGPYAGSGREQFEVCLKMTIERTHSCTWGLWLNEFGDALGDSSRATLEKHLEAEVEWT